MTNYLDFVYYSHQQMDTAQGEIEQVSLNTSFIGAWVSTAFLTLIFAATFLFYISSVKTVQTVSQNFQLYAALPSNEAEVSETVDFGDARAKIVEDFFIRHKSPLAPHSNLFIQVADKYQLDYRLLPAISMQESNGGKKVIKESYNPFGYGIYGSKVIRFTSWEAAIETVGRALREDYLNEGLTTPERIMAKYTPPSLAKGGAWAKGVNSFMEELQ